MLYKDTVYPETLSLLLELNSIDDLSSFSLAGGAALSLKKSQVIC